MLPVLGGEVVERQQFLAVLDQAFDRLGIFGLVSRDEPVERFDGIFLRRAIQISCNIPLAEGCRFLGNLSSTLTILCTQQRC